MYNLNEKQIKSVVFFPEIKFLYLQWVTLKVQKKWTKERQTDYSGIHTVKKVSYEILAEV